MNNMEKLKLYYEISDFCRKAKEHHENAADEYDMQILLKGYGYLPRLGHDVLASLTGVVGVAADSKVIRLEKKVKANDYIVLPKTIKKLKVYKNIEKYFDKLQKSHEEEARVSDFMKLVKGYGSFKTLGHEMIAAASGVVSSAAHNRVLKLEQKMKK